MTLRVLQLATYPARLPRHGGQARVANIRQILERHDFTVSTFAVYEPEHYDRDMVEPHDIAFPASSPFRTQALPYCTDYASGEFLAANEDAFARFVSLMMRLDPHILILEQPWLWPAVKRYRNERRESGFKIVYSSQNIEAPLKREILESSGVREIDAIVALIEARQREVAASCDLTIACTEADAKVLASFGAPRVVVAHNGIVERTADPKDVRDWDWQLGYRRFALFVGSAYPPNGAGFWDIFAPSLAFLAPDQCIVAVGGVSDLLRQYPQYKRWQGINDSRLVRAGFQTEATLAAVISLATCIVLPITRGGGSNIKTAEAIHSGKPVIGTSKSFRGHERTLRLPHVYQVDDPRQFRNTVRSALDGNLPAAPAEDRALRESVLWRETLSAVPEYLADLARN